MRAVLLPVTTRLLAILVALALVGAGVFLLVELFAAVFGNEPVILPADYTDRLRSTGWDEPAVRWVSLGLGIAAVVLLIGALWPRPPLDIEVQVPGMLAERRSVETAAKRRVESIDGVDRALVRVDARHLSARVSTGRRHRPDLVRAAVEDEIRDFLRVHDLPITPLVSVRSGARR
jgi:hypothetical protein